METYAVITGDLVKSRKIRNEDVESVIESLKECFSDINHFHLNGKGKFELYRGDSFQYLIPEPQKALLIGIIIRAKLRTYEPKYNNSSQNKSKKPIKYAFSDARIAIGLGNMSYDANKVTESQGEAFEKSGKAFDKLGKNNDRLLIATFNKEINEELETECLLADAIISKWTASTAEAMYHHLLYDKNQYELSEILRITQPAVHKRLSVYGNLKSIQSFINRYNCLINTI
ncbi:MAG: hypothetical protein PHQ11_02900 [Paludibacter sp.]|nr:hypothetical protein [Paludibacter sp.]MDD4197983.1 hypothetical protein [Paludibacter sp.]MDD4427616.1 hypothetical protein [Paludibacter sp.]